jgi:hypothetical protein
MPAAVAGLTGKVRRIGLTADYADLRRLRKNSGNPKTNYDIKATHSITIQAGIQKKLAFCYKLRFYNVNSNYPILFFFLNRRNRRLNLALPSFPVPTQDITRQVVSFAMRRLEGIVLTADYADLRRLRKNSCNPKTNYDIKATCSITIQTGLHETTCLLL